MLNALIPEPEDVDDEAFFILDSIRKTQKDISIELIFDPANGNETQKWAVDCVGVREYLFRYSFIGNLYVETEHPILLMFNELHAELYFYSLPSNVSELIGKLFICHQESTDDWIPFARFFNDRPGGLLALLSLQSGMLAKGPQTIMKKYADILSSHGISHSLRTTQVPLILDDNKWRLPSWQAKVLLLNESYIVADSFEPRQLKV